MKILKINDKNFYINLENYLQKRSQQNIPKIDLEVKKIIDTNYKKATKLLKDNLDKLHTMAESLLTYETIDADQIDDIMAGAKPRAPKDWDEPKTPKSKSSKKTSIKGPAEEL